MSRRAVLTVALLMLSCTARERSIATSACVECHSPHRDARCETCHRGDALARRKELAHHRLLSGRAAEHGIKGSAVVREGETLVNSLACRRCHTIGGTGGQLATSLDAVVWKREQSALALAVERPVENMPRFGMSPRQVQSTIAFLLSSGRRDSAEPSYRVYFDRSSSEETVFGKNCGGCHRAIIRSGPAGGGTAGPNLSGVLSPFYPDAASETRWTRERLEAWIRNPRAVRPTTTMRPVVLDDATQRQLLEDLRPGEASGTTRRLISPPVQLPLRPVSLRQ